MIFRVGFILLVLSLSASAVQAQELVERRDSVAPPLYRPNVIKFNPTSNLIWDVQSAVFSYERVVKEHQSWGVTFGHLRMTGFLQERSQDTALISLEHKKAFGYSFLFDYRFYLKSENPGFAPHGLFVAPYLAHHHHW